MDFNLSEQEKMLQGLARDFATEEVRPLAMEIDRSGQFPVNLSKEMGARGYRGLPYPANCGGSGAGYLSYALVLEQVSRASMTTGAIMAVNTVPEEAVYRFGTEEQKQTFLTPLARGKLLGGIAFTEPETGSDPKAITAMSRRSAGGFVLSGQKQFVAMAPVLDLAMVFTRREGEGLNAFIVETSSPGVSVGEACDTLGLRGLGTATLYLDDVHVPETALLGEEGQGFEVLLESISLGRLGVAVEALGVAQAALDLSLDYAGKRRARGGPISRLPAIQWHLAEMSARVEATRWLVYHTAFLRDQGQGIRQESAVAKLFASRAAVEVTGMAMQVHGSYGAMRDMTVERLYRDAKMTEIYVGVSELQRSLIAGYMIE
ncbi:MAG: acyl-CoA dehydrogenase family protein [Chloroflexi bacterium]|nr:acyl-CoA dehydrogenase family protein [Chloroflexota bacterium]